MPSTALPSAADDYAAPPGMNIGKAAWDAALTSIGARLRAAEAIRADFQALIDAGAGQALQVIQANVGPQLAALQQEIAAAQAALITAQGKIDALINSTTIEASAVIFAPAGTVSSTTVQAAIAEVASDAAATTTAIAAKADASALASAVSDFHTALAAVKTAAVVSVSAPTMLVAGRAYRIAGGVSIMLTLPDAPAAGDTIRIVDGEVISSSNQPVLARNGRTIMGQASDMTLDAPGVDFSIWWNGADWRLS
ncbi:hypothetical protein SAMN06265338_1158 [Rhodoblastus acidophilus]|uniref:Uncharacterized protein n=1 Tax=Rhodoblastus acidophilus TaxID=1074 RepID=A0A212S7L2_RHOAC|nr:hypothetical protein [Rhodoblastus acidophilus]SNB81288.1 hypothetical protein SAMN06265338_1158 [Rhodoblastus acidophilus]